MCILYITRLCAVLHDTDVVSYEMLTACHLLLHCGELEFHMLATQNFCFLKRFQDKQVAVNAVRNFVWCINCFKQDYLSTSGQHQTAAKHEQEEEAGDLLAIVSAPRYALSIC